MSIGASSNTLIDEVLNISGDANLSDWFIWKGATLAVLQVGGKWK
jgi:hypothetical protein